MKHLFLSKDLALQAREKGFDEQCLAYYHIHETDPYTFHLTAHTECRSSLLPPRFIPAPLYQQIIEWLWDNYKIHVNSYLPPGRTNLTWVTTTKEGIEFWINKEEAIKHAFTLLSILTS